MDSKTETARQERLKRVTSLEPGTGFVLAQRSLLKPHEQPLSRRPAGFGSLGIGQPAGLSSVRWIVNCMLKTDDRNRHGAPHLTHPFCNIEGTVTSSRSLAERGCNPMSSFISPSLIARIYQSLGQNRACKAILLLRQHRFDGNTNEDNDLIPAIIKLGDECYYSGAFSRAEEHYKLGLALYQSCFHQCHVDALRCISGLLQVYSQQNRRADMIEPIALSELVSARIRDAFARPHAVVPQRRAC